MKIIGVLFYGSLLVFSLSACSVMPFSTDDEVPVIPTQQNEFETLIRYGEKFTLAFEKKPLPTCRKYIKRHRKGDWRAAWVLALAVAKRNSALCLNVKDAISTLTTLTRQKKMLPHFRWLTQFHLRQLRLLQKRDKKISQLIKINNTNKKELNENKQRMNELNLENISLSKKLNALKAIEFSINQ
jgi:hypothetical protein